MNLHPWLTSISSLIIVVVAVTTLLSSFITLIAGAPPPSFSTVGTWSTPVFYPLGRFRHATGCYLDPSTNDMHFIITGGQEADSALADSVDLYNIDTGRYTREQTDGLTPRGGHAVFSSSSNRVYIVNGFEDATNFNPSGQVFTQTLGRWVPVQFRSTGSLLSVPLHSFASFQTDTDKDLLWTFSGMTTAGITDQMFVLNVSGGLGEEYWQKITPASSPNPDARFGMCCDYQAGVGALCFGGTNAETEQDDLWRFNTNTLQWSEINVPANAPTRRRYATCSFINSNTFAVFGGEETSGKAIGDTTLYLFNTGSNTWTRVTQKSSNGVLAVNGATLTTCTSAKNGTTRTLLFGGQFAPEQYSDAWLILNTVGSKNEFEGWGHAEAAELPARSFANTHTIGTNVFVMNGLSSQSQAMNDIWSYNIESQRWQDRHSSLSQQWPARWSAASCTNFGSIIYFHGGFATSTGQNVALSDLWSLDTRTMIATNVWAMESTASYVPSARGNHFAFFLDNVIVVVGGASTPLGDALSTFHGYSLVSQDWTILTITGKYKNGTVGLSDWDTSTKTTASRNFYSPRYGCVYSNINESMAVFGMGQDDENLFNDWYFFSLVGDGSTSRAILMKARETSETDSETRSFRRSMAVGVAIGNSPLLFICGGKSATGMITPPLAYTCYQLDLEGEKYSYFSGQQRFSSVVGANIFYFGNTIYLYGGWNGKDRTVLSPTSTSPLLSKFTFLETKTCSSSTYTTYDSSSSHLVNCYECSGGTISEPTPAGSTTNFQCTIVPAGYYRRTGLSNRSHTSSATACPVGTFNPQKGVPSSVGCSPCAFGEFQNETGQANCSSCDESTQICPLGSSEALSRTSARGQLLLQSSSTTEYPPPGYVAPQIPVLPIIIIVIILVLAITVIAVLIFKSHAQKKRRIEFFLPPNAVERLKAIFNEYATGRYGMTEMDFFRFLTMAPDEQARDFFPALSSSTSDRDAFSLEHAHALFCCCDTHKSGMLTVDRFEACAIQVIVNGYMAPFPETESAKYAGPDGTLISSTKELPVDVNDTLQLEDFDQFQDKHVRNDLGQPMKMEKTAYGGATRLIFFVTIIAVTVGVTLDFVINNAQETVSLVPRSVILTDFGRSENLDVETDWETKITIAGVARTRPGISSFEEGCVVVGSTNNTCRDASITLNNVKADLSSSSSSSLACFFDSSAQTCTVIWTCHSCSVPDSSSASALITVSSALSAHYIDVRFSVATGIRNPLQSSFVGTTDLVGGPMEYSSIETVIRPSTNGSVLTGFPPTTIPLGLTSTWFESDRLSKIISTNSEKYLDNGYHVRPSSSVTIGSEAKPSSFDSLFDVPIQLDFSVDTIPLQVKRTLILTLINLLTSLAGALSGVAAMFIIIVHFLDKTMVNPHYKSSNVEFPKKEKAVRVAAVVHRAAMKWKLLSKSYVARKRKEQELEKYNEQEQKTKREESINVLQEPSVINVKEESFQNDANFKNPLSTAPEEPETHHHEHENEDEDDHIIVVDDDHDHDHEQPSVKPGVISLSPQTLSLDGDPQKMSPPSSPGGSRVLVGKSTTSSNRNNKNNNNEEKKIYQRNHQEALELLEAGLSLKATNAILNILNRRNDDNNNNSDDGRDDNLS